MTQVRDSGIRTLRVSVDNQPVAQLENFRTKVFRAAELPQSCRATLPNQPRSRSRSRHSRTISVCAFSTVPQATFLSPGRHTIASVRPQDIRDSFLKLRASWQPEKVS